MPLVTLTLRPGKTAEFKTHVVKETQWENWAFGGGRQIHA